MEPWSYSIEPGRGMEQSMARGRLEGTQKRPKGVPPMPELSVLDGNCSRCGSRRGSSIPKREGVSGPETLHPLTKKQTYAAANSL
eukprot:2512904-Pyramimonas_sp.AAC.1